jgi:hypothetical protein
LRVDYYYYLFKNHRIHNNIQVKDFTSVICCRRRRRLVVFQKNNVRSNNITPYMLKRIWKEGQTNRGERRAGD